MEILVIFLYPPKHRCYYNYNRLRNYKILACRPAYKVKFIYYYIENHSF